jgi:hypothetical protein
MIKSALIVHLIGLRLMTLSVIHTMKVAASILYANDSSAEFTSTSIFPIDFFQMALSTERNNGLQL